MKSNSPDVQDSGPAPFSCDDPDDASSPSLKPTPPALTTSLILLMAFAVGMIVGNLCLIQPLMGDIARDYNVPNATIGYAVTLSQAGLALGTLFLLPLGDVKDRRRLITMSCVCAAISLVVMATAVNAYVFLAANLLLGFTSVATHLQVSYAAHLADPKNRGRAVGAVMSGLLVGILLARVVSGYAGAWLGWRPVLEIAAGLTLVLAVVLRMRLPQDDEFGQIPYGKLLASMPPLFFNQSILRNACIYGMLTFAVFNAFWATLTFYLESPVFGMDSKAVGLFSLVAVAGALTANIAGRLTSVIHPSRIVAASLVITLVSFGVFYLGGTLIVGMGLGIILMDLGIQAAHIGNQTMVHSLMPEARNRLHCVYMVTYFVGGSVGSALGTWSYAKMGWTGLCIACASLTTLALIYWVIQETGKSRTDHQPVSGN